MEEKDINLVVGRNSQTGRVRLSAHVPDQLTLSVCYKGERASAVSLTRQQVRQLRLSLARLEQLMEEPGAPALRECETLRPAA